MSHDWLFQRNYIINLLYTAIDPSLTIVITPSSHSSSSLFGNVILVNPVFKNSARLFYVLKTLNITWTVQDSLKRIARKFVF